MRIIEPSFEIYYDAPINYDCVELIEQGGRKCYQSSWKAMEGGDSATPFTEMLIERGHTSALEHGSIYMETTMYDIQEHAELRRLTGKRFVRYCSSLNGNYENGFISPDYRIYTNFRVVQQYAPTIFDAIIQRQRLPFGLKFFSPKPGDPYRRLSIDIICDRGVSHEIVRNRDGSFSQESTRFCNYAKEQFGKEITVIKPLFWDENDARYWIWKSYCERAEEAYFAILAEYKLRGEKPKPEAARAVLPNSLKTAILVTFDLVGWDYFMFLRTAPGAHPQMREITCPAYAELQEKISSVAWGSRQSHDPRDWAL